MNYNEIRQAINNIEKNAGCGFNELFWSDTDEDIIKACGNYKVVYRFNHGDGNEHGKVLHFTDHNIFIKISGYFSSYRESTIDTFTLVYPHLSVNLTFDSEKQKDDTIQFEIDKIDSLKDIIKNTK